MDTVHDDGNIKGFFEQYRWMSNYHDCPVMWKGLMFKSSEAAYQAAKSLDPKVWEEFTHLGAGTSKKKGKTIEMRGDWDQIKDQMMFDICLDKFMRNEDLKKALLDTGDKYLEETNWWNDQYWGVYKGVGRNQLGITLMKIRDKLRHNEDVQRTI